MILVIILVMCILYVNNAKYNEGAIRESFEESDSYSARLAVIDVFDSYLHRNPTPTEITRYSMHKNEQDILTAVMNDFPDQKTQTDTQAKEGALLKKVTGINSAETTLSKTQPTEGASDKKQLDKSVKEKFNERVVDSEDSDDEEEMIHIPISKVKEMKEYLSKTVQLINQSIPSAKT